MLVSCAGSHASITRRKCKSIALWLYARTACCTTPSEKPPQPTLIQLSQYQMPLDQAVTVSARLKRRVRSDRHLLYLALPFKFLAVSRLIRFFSFSYLCLFILTVRLRFTLIHRTGMDTPLAATSGMALERRQPAEATRAVAMTHALLEISVGVDLTVKLP